MKMDSANATAAVLALLAKAAKRAALWACVWMMASVASLSLAVTSAFADEGGDAGVGAQGGDAALQVGVQSDKASAKRTIMLYVCGSDLEEDSGLATINLRQVLNSNFGGGEDVRLIVMTGGSCQWYLERDKLVFPEGVTVADDAVQRGNPNFDDEVTTVQDNTSEISGPYNQIWEAKSQGATDNPGKLVLLDGDGLKNDRADVTEEWMSDPETLKGFINYCAQNYPAEKYDLILWDHGGGATGGFALDSRRPNSGIAGDTMSFAQIIDALKNNEVTKRSDDDFGNDSKFDFVNFDACLMGSTEIALALADFTDYLLVSPEAIPGRGQVYSGWLNELGTNSDASTSELGKKLVDDFIAYYNEDHEGHVHQEGTMALINTNALLERGFVNALNEIGDAMKAQVENGKFYDELRSVKDSIKYSGAEFYDLGNLVSLLGLSLWELDPDAANNSAVDYSSAYTDAAQTLLSILENPEIVYAGGTSGISKRFRFFMDAAAKNNMLDSSGLHLFFPLNGTDLAVIEYGDAIKAAVEVMPQNDGRADFMRNYVHTMYEYNFVRLAGRSVTEMVNSGNDWTPFGYDKLQEYWKQPIYPNLADILPDYTHYNFHAKPLFEAMDGDKTNNNAEATEAEVAVWLDGVVKQQALEAVSADNVTAISFVTRGGTGSKMTIANTRRRAVGRVRMDVVAELPAVRAYINEHDAPLLDPESEYFDPDGTLGNLIEEGAADLPLGSVQATRDASMDMIEDSTGDFLRDYINWFNNASTTTWNIDPLQRRWYAIKDAEGLLHVAYNDGGSTTASVPVIRMRKGAVGDNPELNVLKFKDGKLTQILLHDDDGTSRVVEASDLKTGLQYMSALYAGTGIGATILPASSSSFMITPGNVDDIELVYTDISKIKDIADVTGDGDSFGYNYTVSDIYGTDIDVTKQVNNPVGELVDIRLVEVEPATYTGEELRPTITYDGKTLAEGVDYTLENDSGRPFLLPGDYAITLHGIGDYADMLIATFVVKPTEDDAAAAMQVQIAIVAELAKIDVAALEAGDAKALAAADAALAAYSALTDVQKTQIEGPVMMALLSVSQKAAAARAALAGTQTRAAKKAQAKAEAKLASAKASLAKNVKTVTVNVKTVTAAAVAKAIADVGGDPAYVTTIVLGPKVKSIKASAFAKCPKVKTLQVQTKKLKKKSVKKSLKGSKVKRIIVNVPKPKVHAKLVKKYKKVFAKKVCGKKVKVQ